MPPEAKKHALRLAPPIIHQRWQSAPLYSGHGSKLQIIIKEVAGNNNKMFDDINSPPDVAINRPSQSNKQRPDTFVLTQIE